MNTRIGVLLLALATATAARAQTINVEVDFMEDETGSDAHSHELTDAEEEAVEQMFACHGLTLNIWVDDSLDHIDVVQPDDSDDSFWTGNGASGFEAIKDAHFDHDGDDGWHYAVMGHQYAQNGATTDSTGLGEIDGDDFIVTFGSSPYGEGYKRAATFAHELGHNLGLDHFPHIEALFTADESPVYASIMSYAYQLHGVRTGLKDNHLIGDTHLFKELDYSSGRLAPAIEFDLDESVGVGIRTTDFDCDGTLESGVSQELDSDDDKNNTWCGESGLAWILTDQDDWSFIKEHLLSEAPKHPRTSAPCAPDVERPTSAEGAFGDSATPTLTTEPCLDAEMYWIDVDGGLSSEGTGIDPGNLVVFIASAELGYVPAGSIFYLQPGTHGFDEPIEITTPMILAGPGGAVINP